MKAVLKKELRRWKSQEVKERFERVGSNLHIVSIKDLEIKIKKYEKKTNKL